MEAEIDILDTPAVAALLGVQPDTLERWRRSDRVGPPWYAIGNHLVRYRRDDVDAWLAAMRKTPGQSK